MLFFVLFSKEHVYIRGVQLFEGRENSRFQWFGLCPMQVDSDEACLQRYATVLLKIIHIYQGNL